MSDWIETICQWIERPNPRFRCQGVGGSQGDQSEFIARVSNFLHSPPSQAERERLTGGDLADLLPKDFLEFYSRFNGVTLYQDLILNAHGFAATGIYIAPIAEWENLREELQLWLDFIDDEDDDLDWLESAIAFAEVPNSGNYFLLALRGDKRGKVVYFSHDGFEFEEYADGLTEFLVKVTSNPAKVLYELGCYTRYTDGKTDIQWIPEAYAAGNDDF
ncbi:SMI1/KNR4 family protein [Synechococcus elongatus]|uniref:SMI1/KNR4 family protein n=1 Tax=Synechococcus elongatus TaxID=32046 RepID=UPI000F7F910A|nr:SMI1/KNR4 family protein [Synechococcus elongatus]